jgi:hypothetical protein
MVYLFLPFDQQNSSDFLIYQQRSFMHISIHFDVPVGLPMHLSAEHGSGMVPGTGTSHPRAWFGSGLVQNRFSGVFSHYFMRQKLKERDQSIQSIQGLSNHYFMTFKTFYELELCREVPDFINSLF